MQYPKLQNIYYKDEKIYLQEYEQRFQALFTKYFDFDIKQFNHRYAYPAFFMLYRRISCFVGKNICRESEAIGIA